MIIKKVNLLIYLTIGIVSFFGYKLIYNTSFDLGLFCDGITDCFSLTQKIIFINWLIFLISTFIFNYFTGNKFFNTVFLFVAFLFNLLKIGSGSSIPFLFILNFFIIALFYRSLKEKNRTVLFINLIILISIFINQLIYISEIFYYNQENLFLEKTLYYFTYFIFIFNLFLLFRQLFLKEFKKPL